MTARPKSAVDPRAHQGDGLLIDGGRVPFLDHREIRLAFLIARAGALDAFIEATYSQEMADAQDDLRAYFRSQNGSLMAFFVDMIRASRFGTWGAKTHIEHESLIWDSLVAYAVANPRNWNQ